MIDHHTDHPAVLVHHPDGTPPTEVCGTCSTPRPDHPDGEPAWVPVVRCAAAAVNQPPLGAAPAHTHHDKPFACSSCGETENLDFGEDEAGPWVQCLAMDCLTLTVPDEFE